ncbi:pilus assembly protein N-terminal domain-containing protein, partial [Comamonas sp. JC664]|uniref:pilus assembly protein N-terminal domain-containing protein n=1 Tax=Comamonas sp. JC664 TaxID=2801917 RepID=UPI0036067F24
AGKAAAPRPARPAELLLTPKAAGSTTLMVWPSQGEPQTWSVVVSGPRLLLERRLQSLPEHARASAELAATAPKGTPLTDRAQVEVRSNTVQVDVQVVEFKKSAMRRAGVQLNSGGANDHGFQFGVYTPGSNGSSSGSSSGSSGNGSGTDGGTSAIASAMNLVLGFGRPSAAGALPRSWVFSKAMAWRACSLSPPWWPTAARPQAFWPVARSRSRAQRRQQQYLHPVQGVWRQAAADADHPVQRTHRPQGGARGQRPGLHPGRDDQ